VPSEFLPLHRDPLTVTLAGTQFTVPYRPAAVWTQAMVQPQTLAAALADQEERDEMADLLLDYPQAVDELRQESLRILSEATGWKWWEGGRLLNTSVQSEVLGRLVLANVDPWARSVSEWCAAVYALCVKGQDEKGRIKFDFSLSVPPPGYEDEWDDGGDDPMEFLSSIRR